MSCRIAHAWLLAALALGAAGARAQNAPDAPSSRGAPSSAGAFNPAISLILSGTYANLQRDPENWRLRGFLTGGEIGPGTRSFNLGESELGVSANIDPMFYGSAAVAITPQNEASVEEAFIQTTSLGNGFTAKFGRFFSGIGYLNEQHAHTWDFVDNPFAYQAFLGAQVKQDGIQVRWLAPTPIFVELGGEIGRGQEFPGAERNVNGAGMRAAFVHAGGDVGVSNSWRAGVSYLQASPRDRVSTTADPAGNPVDAAFGGSSRLWLADFVWKWSPNGNPARQNLKLQAEYFNRRERGTLTVDPAGAATADVYSSRQSGAYVQAVWQFQPRWRTGLRYDRLDSGSANFAGNTGAVDGTKARPTRVTWMADWNPSEFSRLRLQLARDRARDQADNQIFIQYQMSLGAHGAHSF